VDWSPKGLEPVTFPAGDLLQRKVFCKFNIKVLKMPRGVLLDNFKNRFIIQTWAKTGRIPKFV
jgi:hypothetical protein